MSIYQDIRKIRIDTVQEHIVIQEEFTPYVGITNTRSVEMEIHITTNLNT